MLQTLTYNPSEINKNNQILYNHGFNILGLKPLLVGSQLIPFYSVVEHPKLPGYVIKSGATRIPKDQFTLGPLNDRMEISSYTEEESLLRIPMSQRITKIARQLKIEVEVPKKKLVAYANSAKEKNPTKKYCVICEKKDVLSLEDMLAVMKAMDGKQQKDLAIKICHIVKKVGLVDASLFHNIRFKRTSDKKIVLVFLDTEPTGLMIKKTRCWQPFLGSKPASVEKCARIGLYTLRTSLTRAICHPEDDVLLLDSVEPGLEAFYNQVDREYKKIIHSKFAK